MAQQLLVMRKTARSRRRCAHGAARHDARRALPRALDARRARRARRVARRAQLMSDPNPRMRVQAIRASETLYKGGDTTLAADWRRLTHDSSRRRRHPGDDDAEHAPRARRRAGDPRDGGANQARGVQLVGKQILEPAGERGARTRTAPLSAAEASLVTRGAAMFRESVLVVPRRRRPRRAGRRRRDGRAAARRLPRVTGHRDYVIQRALHGLTGPIEGQDVSPARSWCRGRAVRRWIAGVASYVRHALERASSVRAAEVARGARRAPRAARRRGRTRSSPPRCRCSCTSSRPGRRRRATSRDRAVRAFGTAGGRRGGRRRPGMWFQFELPEPTTLAELASCRRRCASRGRVWRLTPRPTRSPARGRRSRYVPARLPRAAVDGRHDVERAGGGGAGQRSGRRAITFAPTRARFVRITQTATPDGSAETPPGTLWAVQQLRLWTVPGAR